MTYFKDIYNAYTVNVGTFDTVEKDKNGKSVRKIIVVNQNINETLDENGFVIIGAIDFLLRFIK